jgi:hypothetical protein
MTRKETFGKCDCIFTYDQVLLTKAIDETIKTLNKKPDRILEFSVPMHVSHLISTYKGLKEKLENTELCDNLVDEVKDIKKVEF